MIVRFGLLILAIVTTIHAAALFLGAATQAQNTPLVPLTELQTPYKGESGGLYGDGRNEAPESQATLAKAALAQIRPLGADGKPAADGKVVLISIGMSNTTQEFSAFKQLADREPGKSPKLVIVDGAQGSQDSVAWAQPNGQRPGGQPTRQPGMDPWAELDRRLSRASVSPQQVQVAWLKQATMQPQRYGAFPKHAQALENDIAVIIRQAREKFPNLRIVYLSSRIYAGYATTGLNPEPYAYEGAFSVRWLIEAQVKGQVDLNADPAKGKVVAPLLLWGPYLWAAGQSPRKSDGLVWLEDDLVPQDRTHPSNTGRRKVADLLLKFFKEDPLAKGWFLAAAE